ncbi:Uncharacterized protein HZ326_16125 [Fusarium oxysporum f. sp. albedinis]|nr:Uncharacterized protein HZ326_16125 [Fusarium oxysporum f. sp. albedinis]
MLILQGCLGAFPTRYHLSSKVKASFKRHNVLALSFFLSRMRPATCGEIESHMWRFSVPVLPYQNTVVGWTGTSSTDEKRSNWVCSTKADK